MPGAATGERAKDTGGRSVVHMATIAKVLTQDGQAAVGPVADAAGNEPGVEFLALLSGATGATLAPASPGRPTPAVASADEEGPPGETAGPVACSMMALVAAGDPRRSELSAAAPNADPARTSPPAVTAGAMPAVRSAAVPDAEPACASPRADASEQTRPALPDPAPRPAPEVPLPPAEVRSGPVASPPAPASPVATAVLSALQAGTRPVPHDAVPPAAGRPVVDPVPVADSVGLSADVAEEFVAADAGTRAESDADGAPSGTASPAMPGSRVARDATAVAVHQRTLPGMVGTPAWRHELGAEVRLMIERGIGAATLRLSPEHLGPVEVRIDLADDSANVWFTASHADTRLALADALPRLRDMLASVGVNLGEAGVHRDPPGEAERRESAWRDAGPSATEAGAESHVVVTRLDAGRGMVDEYA